MYPKCVVSSALEVHPQPLKGNIAKNHNRTHCRAQCVVGRPVQIDLYHSSCLCGSRNIVEEKARILGRNDSDVSGPVNVQGGVPFLDYRQLLTSERQISVPRR